MFPLLRSFTVRRKTESSRIDAEIRAWILETIRHASLKPWLMLFFAFDARMERVHALICDHGSRDCLDEDCGAIRINDWEHFYALFRECADPYLKSPIREGSKLVLGFVIPGAPYPFPHEIRVFFFDPEAFKRGFALPDEPTAHDCEAGVCTSGDLC